MSIQGTIETQPYSGLNPFVHPFPWPRHGDWISRQSEGRGKPIRRRPVVYDRRSHGDLWPLATPGMEEAGCVVTENSTTELGLLQAILREVRIYKMTGIYMSIVLSLYLLVLLFSMVF